MKGTGDVYACIIVWRDVYSFCSGVLVCPWEGGQAKRALRNACHIHSLDLVLA